MVVRGKSGYVPKGKCAMSKIHRTGVEPVPAAYVSTRVRVTKWKAAMITVSPPVCGMPSSVAVIWSISRWIPDGDLHLNVGFNFLKLV